MSATVLKQFEFQLLCKGGVVARVLVVLMGSAIVAATACLLKDCLYELGTQQTMQERGFG